MWGCSELQNACRVCVFLGYHKFGVRSSVFSDDLNVLKRSRSLNDLENTGLTAVADCRKSLLRHSLFGKCFDNMYLMLNTLTIPHVGI
jgi:hypothetical protein